MPLKKICSCGKVINYSLDRCVECQAKYDKQLKKKHQEYKNKRTDKKEQEFYNSKEWIKTRDSIKIDFKGLCLYSYYVLNKIVFSDVVHHIIELKEDWDKRIDKDNLITLCSSVHNTIHSLYDKNEDSKLRTQEMLRGLIKKWNRDFGSGGL